MAKIASAEKRNRQGQKRRARNLRVRTGVKTAVKKVRELAEKGDAPGAKAALQAAVTALSKASSKGVLHRNAAARRIGRLARAVAALGAAR